MDEIATVITREAGMPKWLSLMIQAGLPINSFNTAAQLAESYEYESTLGNSLVVKEPVGVVGCITPWNYPLHQIAAKVAYAMAAGCTVVLKPSEVAPLDAFILAEVIDDVGLPAGVFNLVTGTGPRWARPSPRHPAVDMVSFTGSTRAGKRVAEVAAADAQAGGARAGRQVGQRAARRPRRRGLREGRARRRRQGLPQLGPDLHRPHPHARPRRPLADAERIAADEAETKFRPTDPFAEGAMLGPLSSQAQVDRVTGYIQKGIDEGAKLVTGGPGAPEGLDKRLLRAADRVLRGAQRHDHRPGGDLRAGPVDHRLPGRGRRRRHRQRLGLRPGPAACGAPTPSGPRRSPAASAPARSRSTAAPSTRAPRSAASRTAATAGSTASTASRSSSRSSPCSSEVRGRRGQGSPAPRRHRPGATVAAARRHERLGGAAPSPTASATLPVAQLGQRPFARRVALEVPARRSPPRSVRRAGAP